MTGGIIKYKYISENAPEEKIDYSYSKFYGEKFLEAWMDSRKICYPGDQTTDIPEITNTNCSNTENLLVEWIKSFQIRGQINYDQLNLLLKRFEVTKKIFESYNEQFRSIDRSKYKQYRLYILFGVLLAAAYEKTNKLQYLNSLLKVNDISLSIVNLLNDQERKLLNHCVCKERDYIISLKEQLKWK